MPKYLPARLTQYLLNSFSKKSLARTTPPKTTLRLPLNDSKRKILPDTNRFEVEAASSRRCTRRIRRDSCVYPGKGKLVFSCLATIWLRYWVGTPNQHRHTNRLYHRTRIGAAQRELSRSSFRRFLVPGYGYVSHAYWLRQYCNTVLPIGAHVWCKGEDGL